MQGGGGGGIVMLIIQLAILIFTVVTMWKIFVKAGKPGWAAIVPVYSAIVFLDIAGKPWWWIFLFCIPLVNIVIVILVLVGFFRNFGKGVGWVVASILVPLAALVLMAMLAFGSAEYTKVETAA